MAIFGFDFLKGLKRLRNRRNAAEAGRNFVEEVERTTDDVASASEEVVAEAKAAEEGTTTRDKHPEIPVSGLSRALTGADFGIEGGLEQLAGTVSVRGTEMLVRVENIVVGTSSRGRTSIFTSIKKIREMARRAGMKTLLIEGVSVGNADLGNILIRRYGARFTSQRTLVARFPLKNP